MPSMVSLYRFSTIANSNMAFKTVSENPIWRKSKMAAKIDPKIDFAPLYHETKLSTLSVVSNYMSNYYEL